MRTLARLILAGACALSLQSPAFAAGHATSADARALLDKAVVELSTVGREKALAEFNQPGGTAFNTGELYVFVFDAKGIYAAYGANPGLVGTDAHDLKDARGKYLVREMIAAARAKGDARVSYVWLNRADNRVEHKKSFVRRVGDLIVGVGYYEG